MIDIGKFARPLITPGANPPSFFRFACADNSEMAKELRRFADKVESGEVLIQKVQAGQIVSLDDYMMQALLFEFAEHEKSDDPQVKKTPERIIKLAEEQK